MNDRNISVVVVTAVEPVARATALGGLLLDLPDSVVIDYVSAGGALRRTVTDRTGTVFDDVVDADPDCLGCALREDLAQALRTLADLGRWRVVVVAPPLTMSPIPIVHQLLRDDDDPRSPWLVNAVVAVVDGVNLERDLLGDDLLAERGIAVSADDRRSVGEAVAHQLEFADVVVAVTSGSSTDTELLRRLAAADATVHEDWTEFRGELLLEQVHDLTEASRRVDPLVVDQIAHADHDQVWTVHLRSDRPLHPERLMHHIEELGTGRIRARGHFWLASRPADACVWDASGGQLSIGSLAGWAGHQPGTRLQVTGVDRADRTRILAAFDSVAATPEDLGALSGQRAEDGFEPWLGAVG